MNTMVLDLISKNTRIGKLKPASLAPSLIPLCKQPIQIHLERMAKFSPTLSFKLGRRRVK